MMQTLSRINYRIVGFVLVLLVAWESATVVFGIHPVLLPPPSRVAEFIVENAAVLFVQTGVTTYEALLGLALGLTIGMLFGMVVGISGMLRNMTLPLLLVTDVTPKIALVPLLLIILGFGLAPKIVLVVLIIFFPIVINTAEGIRSVDPNLLDLARSLKAGRWKIFLKIRLPNALPYVFAGIRIGTPLSFVGAVIAELVGGKEGIGWVLIDAIFKMRTDQTIAGIMFVGAVGVATFHAISLLEMKAMPWYREERPVIGVY